MGSGLLLDSYLAILRKHWIQVTVIFVAVLGAGLVYLSRQRPAFEATVKLRISRQSVKRAGTSIPFSFEEDQVFYNTQYNLLTTQLEWANRVLDRAAFRLIERVGGWSPKKSDAALKAAVEKTIAGAAGLCGNALVTRAGGAEAGGEFDELEAGTGSSDPDPDLEAAVARVRSAVIEGGFGLTPDAFLAGVRVTPIPSTYLAELSFTASDPGVAVYLANLYAELYRDVSTKERKEKVGRRVRALDDRLDQVSKSLDDARHKKSALLQKDAALTLGPSNPAQDEANAISARINSLTMERILAESSMDRLRELLRSSGLEIVYPRDPQRGRIQLEATGDGGDLSATLGKHPDILGLPVVEKSDNVRQGRARIRADEAELARLHSEFTSKSTQVKRAEDVLEKDRRALARQVAGVIVQALEEDRDRTQAIKELEGRLAEKQEAAQKQNKLYASYLEIKSRIDSLSKQKDGLLQQITELRKIENSARGSEATAPLAIQNIDVERRARIRDADQVRPRTTIIVLLTCLAAVFLGFGSAFVMDVLDDTVKTKDDFERLVSVPDLGLVPRISEKEFARKDLAVVDAPRSGPAEAFRSIRTGILFSRKDDEIRSFLITSAGPGEGKTTIAVNLAAAMAEAGRGKVLLVDADLRRPRIHTVFGLDNSSGLTNLLIGGAKLRDVVRPTGVENLWVLTAGPPPPNPAELLGGHRTREILSAAREEFGKVVLDTPPLVAVTDTNLLAPLVEGVFLVISMGKTSWRLIAQAKESLSAVGESVTGAVLNNIRSHHRGYGYHSGYYSYGRSEKKKT